MVKIELGKRDFIWIGLIVVLFGVGFGYAYNVDGSGDPSVMGHSIDEITTCAADEYLRGDGGCGTAAEIVSAGGGSGSGSNDIVVGQHTSAECEAIGGEVVVIDEGNVCRFEGASCAPGWTHYLEYSTTVDKYCNLATEVVWSSYSNCHVSFHTCSTGSHEFSDIAQERCTYALSWSSTWGDPGQNVEGGCDRTGNTCYSTVSQVGCY